MDESPRARREQAAPQVDSPPRSGTTAGEADVTVTNPVAAFLGQSKLIKAGRADVARVRERTRRRRLLRVAFFLAFIDAFLWYRVAIGDPLGPPSLPDDAMIWLPGMLLVLILALVLLLPMGSGRSPHLLVRPEHIETGLEDVKGLDPQVDEVVRSLNVFLGYSTFRERLGGNPRRGILFEGPPGTGKTYLAKAMAKQAGVPFLYVSAPAFQSMWFGMTGARIRSFFRALRKLARREGGAIGFIEEIDAIGTDRAAGAAMSPADAPGRAVSRMVSPGTGGMVNELLIQMQSFDQPPWTTRARDRFVEWFNGYLPAGKRIRTRRPEYHNILLIAATNRADTLDPALLRPGRFDRRLYFDAPTKKGRRELIDYFLDRKSHEPDLDDEAARERLAHDTLGYTPVMVEHLFDEALLIALRNGRDRMTVADVYEAKLSDEIGLKQPVVYTEAARRAVATHEAGHATAAYILGTTRRLEVLSIIKRRQSLGLLAHADLEERFTKSRSELEAALAISLAGMAAEELFLGESGTGPASDLTAATEVAAAMVGALGMGGSLVSYEAIAEGPVSMKNLVGKVLADGEGKARVENLLAAQKERSVAVLSENRDVVEALRDALMERDELVGNEITAVIKEALARRGLPAVPDVNV
ncbi:MAG TPA: AAA family ATPase [Actinomycetota bacterium]|nr:AAA family ATPase [Actinomycetota bacterium]